MTIGDSAPTTDPYNLAIAEILAAPSGTSQITGQAIDEVCRNHGSGRKHRSQAAAAPNSGGALALDDLAGNAVTNACSPGGSRCSTGANLTTQTPQTPTSFPLPTQLADLQVNVNGIPAPLLFASDSQVRFQCPLLPSGTPLQINLQAASGLSIPSAASLMKSAAPELFMYGSTNRGVILLGPSSELTKLDNQAVVAQSIQAGETLTIYANGLGDFRRQRSSRNTGAQRRTHSPQPPNSRHAGRHRNRSRVCRTCSGRCRVVPAQHCAARKAFQPGPRFPSISRSFFPMGQLLRATK